MRKIYEVVLEYKGWIFKRRETRHVSAENEIEAKAMAKFLFWARTGKNSKAISARVLEKEIRQHK